MKTRIQVLTAEEKNTVHDRSLAVLAKTGLRVEFSNVPGPRRTNRRTKKSRLTNFSAIM